MAENKPDEEDSTHPEPKGTGATGECPRCGHPIDDCYFSKDGRCIQCVRDGGYCK